MTYVSLLVGFILLIKGADYFVEGSSAVARKFHIPSMVIGMTIVAMGTSLPECAVSVTASIAGSNELAVSNVVGSNIFNLMVVCGACTLWTPMAVSQKTLKQELPFSIAMGVILLILGYSGMAISRADGLIFLVIFVCFLMWMVRAAKANPVQPEEEEPKMLPGWKCALYILLGGAAIMWGGGSGGGFGIGHCSEFWTEPEPYWFDDCSYGNFPAGVGDLCGCLPKRGSGYGPWKCIGL